VEDAAAAVARHPRQPAPARGAASTSTAVLACRPCAGRSMLPEGRGHLRAYARCVWRSAYSNNSTTFPDGS
jgi:hypothetical protein